MRCKVTRTYASCVLLILFVGAVAVSAQLQRKHLGALFGLLGAGGGAVFGAVPGFSPIDSVTTAASCFSHIFRNSPLEG